MPDWRSTGHWFLVVVLCALSAGCDQSGVSGDLETMQNAAWRIRNAVNSDRPAELLSAMRAFEDASAVAHSHLDVLGPTAQPTVMAQWSKLHDEVDSQLQSAKGQRVVDAIASSSDAADWVELHSSMVDER